MRKLDVASPTLAPRSVTSSAPTHGWVNRVRFDHLARVVLAAFLFIFMASRIVVFLVMAHQLPPQLFLYVHGTHVHHLNYGIFILSAVGALLLFVQPTGSRLTWTAAAYGVGLALTFDEFGMWLRLGGPYWQRASFDAVVVIAAMLALVAYGRRLEHIRRQQWWMFAGLLAVAALFGSLLIWSINVFGQMVGPIFRNLEGNVKP